MTAETRAGLNLCFSPEDILEGVEESFHAAFLSKMKLKHFLVSVETRNRWIVNASILYAMYCAIGLMWISVIQHAPHLKDEIQDFSSRMTSYAEFLHAHSLLLALMALAFERIYALFKLTIPGTKNIFSAFLANLKTKNSVTESRNLVWNLSRLLLIHGIVTLWDVCPNLKAFYPDRDYHSLVQYGTLTQQECSDLSANKTKQPEIAANWLLKLVRDALAKKQLYANRRSTDSLLEDIRRLNVNLDGI